MRSERFEVAALGWSVGDWTALWLALVALLFLAIQRRLPAGLGIAVFSAAASVALAVFAYEHFHPDDGLDRVFLPQHVTAGLCLIWGVFAWIASMRGRSGGSSEASITATRRTSPSSVLFSWSLVTGVAAAVLLIHPMVFMIWDRVVRPDFSYRRLAPDGLWDIAALMVTTAVWAVTGRRRQQPVLLLSLAAAFVIWTCLMIAPGGGGLRLTGFVTLSLDAPRWWNWTLHMQASLAGVLLIATVFQDLRFRRRQAAAWPDRLDDLVKPYSDWPGYPQVEAVMASIVLILGVYQIVRGAPWDWRPNAVSAMACAISGVVCMFVTYRRWSPNTTELGVASFTLAIMMIPTTLAAQLILGRETGEYSSRMPTIFNASLFGLAVMIGFWTWLGAFWKQQLVDNDGKTAWTTAGRMISPMRRANFLIASLAVMVAFQMALWPERVPTSDLDDSPGRMAAGLLVLAMLTFITARAAIRANSPAFASLSLIFVAAAGAFAMIMLRGWHERGLIVQYAPVLLSVLSLPALFLSETATRRQWRAFPMPLNLVALLLLPAVSLWQVVPTAQMPTYLAPFLPAERLPTEWIRPATLVILAVLYGVAARVPSRRPFLALAVVLLIGAGLSYYRGRLRVEPASVSLHGQAAGQIVDGDSPSR